MSDHVDMVNHPPHYKSASGVECIDITEHLPFCEGNAVKYVWRCGKKGDVLEDLRKARWYADRARSLIEREEWRLRKNRSILNDVGRLSESSCRTIIRYIVSSALAPTRMTAKEDLDSAIAEILCEIEWRERGAK